VFRDHSAVAARQAIPPEPALFEMIGGHGQNVTLPLSGGKAHGRVQGIFRRVRASIHPDGSLRSPREMVEVDSHQVLGVSVIFFPNPDIGEGRGIVGGMHAALVFGEREQRRVPSLAPQAIGGIDRKPGIVAQFRTGKTVREILIKLILPDAAQVDLGECRAARQRCRQYQRGQACDFGLTNLIQDEFSKQWLKLRLRKRQSFHSNRLGSRSQHAGARFAAFLTLWLAGEAPTQPAPAGLSLTITRVALDRVIRYIK